MDGMNHILLNNLRPWGNLKSTGKSVCNQGASHNQGNKWIGGEWVVDVVQMEFPVSEHDLMLWIVITRESAFLMRYRISIRGSVRPSIRPSVGPSVRRSIRRSVTPQLISRR